MYEIFPCQALLSYARVILFVFIAVRNLEPEFKSPTRDLRSLFWLLSEGSGVFLIISDMSGVNPGFAVVMYERETFAYAGNRLRLDSQHMEYLAAFCVRVLGIVSE